MTNHLNPMQVEDYAAAFLRFAKETSADPHSQLQCSAMLVETGTSLLLPRTLTATTDYQALQQQILGNHLMCQRTFSLMATPRHHQATQDVMLGAPTTLALYFRPATASRELGWRRPKPPSAPNTVPSAKVLRGAWRLEIELTRLTGDDLVPDEEPQAMVYEPTDVATFSTALQRTLAGIEFGHDVLAFGNVDANSALGSFGGTLSADDNRPKPPANGGKSSRHNLN